MSARPDVLIVGGGLSGGLIALALADRRPEIDVAVLEAGPEPGGNHTWCFHGGDLGPDEAALVDPLVAHRWPIQDVVFPAYRRRLEQSYCAVTSDRFAAVMRDRLGSRIRTGARVTETGPSGVTFADGTGLKAGVVIDARGPRPTRHLSCGWQVFAGLEVRLETPVDMPGPIVMDATVPQRGGYRFVYVLPFAPDRLLIEATAYADRPAFSTEAFEADARAYAAREGWRIAEVVRRESGVLPIALDGRPERLWSVAAGVPHAGLRAGLFHPMTGYSLPEAARLALLVAGLADLSATALFAAVRDHALARWRHFAFYRGLGRMLFLAAEPERRVDVFARFYGLPAPLIARFYAGENTLADKGRILVGRPPVPIPSAVRALVRRHPVGAAA